MTLQEYQSQSQTFDLTSTTPEHQSHALFQFSEEVGEVMGIFKRRLRGDKDYQDDAFVKSKLEKEIGDCLWGLAAICASSGLSLQEVAKSNIAKLQDRYNRGVIQGQGDSR